VCVIPENSLLFIPDAFSPNGDNINEEWGIVGNGFERYDLRIFDRWGRLIFASTNPSEKWNGKDKGEPCPEGAYMWRLISKMYLPDSKGNYRPQWVEKKGTVTLIR
jgi:gliding motility-associated-like protein